MFSLLSVGSVSGGVVSHSTERNGQSSESMRVSPEALGGTVQTILDFGLRVSARGAELRVVLCGQLRASGLGVMSVWVR